MFFCEDFLFQEERHDHINFTSFIIGKNVIKRSKEKMILFALTNSDKRVFQLHTYSINITLVIGKSQGL